MAKAAHGDKVSIHYTGKLDSGEIFDSSVDREPLMFVIGRGMLIKGFEDGVLGMDVGDKKTLKLSPEEAYGNRMDEMILVVPMTDFPPNIKPESGMMLSLQQSNGSSIPAMITEVSGESVTLDANHPLAGKNLTFELEMMANHGPAAEDDDCGMGSCGCGCGDDDCGDDCCSHCH